MYKQRLWMATRLLPMRPMHLQRVAAIFPMTPSAPIAEGVDEWSAHGKKNIFGTEVKVVEMQSEAGAASAMRVLPGPEYWLNLYGIPGLLLMIPSLYKMAGNCCPGVLHVSARSIATHALSIYGDHQDVMACRQTGVSMLASQQCPRGYGLWVLSHTYQP